MVARQRQDGETGSLERMQGSQAVALREVRQEPAVRDEHDLFGERASTGADEVEQLLERDQPGIAASRDDRALRSAASPFAQDRRNDRLVEMALHLLGRDRRARKAESAPRLAASSDR